MAGSGNDKELHTWQTLAKACQDEGCDALELNFSCPHMDRVDMGSNVGKDKVLCSVVTQAVKEVSKIPVGVKLTPATVHTVGGAQRPAPAGPPTRAWRATPAPPPRSPPPPLSISK